MDAATLGALFGGIASVLTAIGMIVASLIRGRTSIRKSELERLKSDLKERDAQLNEADAHLAEAETRIESLRNDYWDAQDIVSLYRGVLADRGIPMPQFKRHRDKKKKGRVEEALAADDY